MAGHFRELFETGTYPRVLLVLGSVVVYYLYCFFAAFFKDYSQHIDVSFALDCNLECVWV
jgi:hypothetical protein